MAAVSKIVPYIIDPLTAETVTVWHAPQLVCEIGYQHVLLQGDSLSVILELKMEVSCGSGCGQLNYDIKLIFPSLASHSFQHV